MKRKKAYAHMNRSINWLNYNFIHDHDDSESSEVCENGVRFFCSLFSWILVFKLIADRQVTGKKPRNNTAQFYLYIEIEYSIVHLLLIFRWPEPYGCTTCAKSPSCWTPCSSYCERSKIKSHSCICIITHWCQYAAISASSISQVSGAAVMVDGDIERSKNQFIYIHNHIHIVSQIGLWLIHV